MLDQPLVTEVAIASQNDEPSGDSSQQQADMTLQIVLAKGQVGLTEDQQSCIAAWRNQWAAVPGKLTLMLGGACHTSRVGRLRRLHRLITVLEQLGVAAKRILLEFDWDQPMRMGSLDDVPADIMWITLCPHSRRLVAAYAAQ